jgi:hypothetical protein
LAAPVTAVAVLGPRVDLEMSDEAPAQQVVDFCRKWHLPQEDGPADVAWSLGHLRVTGTPRLIPGPVAYWQPRGTIDRIAVDWVEHRPGEDSPADTRARIKERLADELRCVDEQIAAIEREAAQADWQPLAPRYADRERLVADAKRVYRVLVLEEPPKSFDRHRATVIRSVDHWRKALGLW